MVKSRRAASSARSVGEGDDGAAAEGLDVAAEGRDLERPAVGDHGDGAVREAGRHRLQPGRRGERDHRLRHGVGGDVDVGDRPAEQRVAHAAADEERLVPGVGQQRAGPPASPAPPASPPSIRVTDPASGPRASSASARWRPRCSAGRRGSRSSGASWPCQRRPCTCRLAGSSTKASGTSKTSSTSARSSTGRKPGGDEADERGDGEVGDRLVQVERAEHLDARRVEADLLLGLAQRRVERGRVARLLLAAGEGDLAGMVLEERGAAGQDEVEARRRARSAAPAPRRAAAAATPAGARRG